mgnify:CR=1 FL=1
MIRKIVKKIIYGNKCDANTYIKYLKRLCFCITVIPVSSFLPV